MKTSVKPQMKNREWMTTSRLPARCGAGALTASVLELIYLRCLPFAI
jgi:hypothetical protein